MSRVSAESYFLYVLWSASAHAGGSYIALDVSAIDQTVAGNWEVRCGFPTVADMKSDVGATRHVWTLKELLSKIVQ